MNYRLWIKKISWIIPFLAFCTGYFCLQFFVTDTNIQAPNLLGQTMLQATKTCSQLQLNLRIITEKEVADAQPGTIFTQNPMPGKSIKKHQAIFIVITKTPPPITAPECINLEEKQIEKICKEKDIKVRLYQLPSQHAAGKCFAQIPTAGQELETKKISCYISAPKVEQFLFPDFTDISLTDVITFLQQNNITYDVFYKNQKIAAPYQQSLQVTYQKPLAGSIINSMQNVYVQLQVK